MEARQEIETRIRNALQHKKMANRKLGVGYLMHDSEAIFNSAPPLLQTQKPIKSATLKPPEVLPAGLDDQLPKFDFTSFPSLNLTDSGEEDQS